jgi:lipid A 3-O-deacylase
MTRGSVRVFLICVVLSMAIACCPGKVRAEAEQARDIPNKYGLACSFGYAYDTKDDTTFMLLTAVGLFDYEKVWHHAAPDALRFKVEVSAGSTLDPTNRFMASVNFFALYYLDWFKIGTFRPYIEGGIGAIYTDFREEGQGTRFNFNPQAGIGAEFTVGSGLTFFSAIRAHHISNAGIDDQNRGINSVVFMLGHYF